MTPKDEDLLEQDLEAWPELFGYDVPEGSSLEERVALRRQHAEALSQAMARSADHAKLVAQYGARLADLLDHVNSKTEDRVCEIQNRLTEIAEVLTIEKAVELGELVQDVVSKLQFQDIQRQELESISAALRGFSEFFSEAETLGVTDMMEMLPEVLASYVPRSDIDAKDVDEEEAGPVIELF